MNVSSFQLSLEQDFQIRLIERSMQDTALSSYVKYKNFPEILIQ
jgi:hypothetical protein